MKYKTIAIVQARMGSSRFPGKSLERIGKWSLIELVMGRVNQSSKVDKVVLATSTNPKDDVLENHVRQLGFPVFRGSEEDVLSRFYETAKSFEPATVVRITGDCPLISPRLIDYAIDRFVDKQVDYLSLSVGNDKKLAYPRGFDVEVASFKSLSKAAEKASKQYEREHVMPYLYTNPESFSVYYLEPIPELSRPKYRLCVDTKQDLELILRVYEFFGEELFDAESRAIIQFLDENPQVAMLNQSARQKHFTETDTRMEQ
jgi:spore coat polysaccharide biosynthesis protein SpsF